MSHDLFQDRMAFVGEAPWHGLGTRVLGAVTAAEMIEAANLAWAVRKVPALGARPVGNRKGPFDRYVIQRDPAGREPGPVALAIVGPAYEPLQNADAFAFFEPFVRNRWAEFHTAGALGNGERVWVLARMRESIVVAPDDIVDRFLLLSNTHDGSGAVTIRFTPVRVVCQNTLSFAMRGGSGIEAVRHTRNMEKRLAEAQAKQLKRVVDKVFGQAWTLFGRMAALELKTGDIDTMLEALFPRTPAQKAKDEMPDRWRRIKGILDDPRVTPPGTRDTLWGLYNAVVRDEDYRATRERAPEARLERVWFGRGRDLKLRALQLARRQLAMAA